MTTERTQPETCRAGYPAGACPIGAVLAWLNLCSLHRGGAPDDGGGWPVKFANLKRRFCGTCDVPLNELHKALAWLESEGLIWFSGRGRNRKLCLTPTGKQRADEQQAHQGAKPC